MPFELARHCDVDPPGPAHIACTAPPTPRTTIHKVMSYHLRVIGCKVGSISKWSTWMIDSITDSHCA